MIKRDENLSDETISFRRENIEKISANIINQHTQPWKSSHIEWVQLDKKSFYVHE